MNKKQNLWSREEIIIALDLYYKIPFSKTTKNNPKIIETAKIIGRSPSSLAMKLGNFGSFDTDLKKKNISGLINASKLDKQIYCEFENNLESLAYEKEKAIANIKQISIEQHLDIDLSKINSVTEKIIKIKQRVNQNFFRSSILGLYNSRCCITGISIPNLLEAAHIVDWSKDVENRLNPINGLCLNALHHKAYDNFLISITPDYKIVINEDKLLNNNCDNKNIIYSNFIDYKNKTILLPDKDKYKPNKELLEQHYHRFIKQN